MELHVTGMTCGGCVKAVTRAVQNLDKSAIVAVDLPSGTVTIDGALTRSQAIEAITAAGFSLAA